ncbi:MAG: S1 RNA-binding domain-containing protein [Clostridia bacterium]|nr:S1 RNA-binding domain-containing protein [Clostridia bacterium]
MENQYLPEGLLLGTARCRELTESLAGLRRAMEEGAIVEGMAVMCDASLDLHVRFPALPDAEGIIPRREAVFARPGETVKDIAILTRVGKAVACRVLSVGEPDEAGQVRVLLSRRLAQEECAARFVSALMPGDVIRGRVTHMEPFGAFVDVGCGLSSLMSVDAISVSRIDHPHDRLYNGQLIWAAVRAVDASGRLFLSMRELLGTWEQNAARFRAGQTVVGIIRSVEEYGIFVELTPNLAGLCELRDCDRRRIEAMKGRTAGVFIKSIIPERMKVKLVLIDGSAGDVPPQPRLDYFIRGDEVTHIDRWVYSPACAAKRVETVFGS